jgi:hypothetical protein
MAYLKNDDNKIVIDAILTKYGKEKLAKSGSLNITKFAVSDDEVDYSLYNVNNPQGTDYFNSAIVNMPLLEALVDPNLSMKYKLFSADAVQQTSPIDVVSELKLNYSSNFKNYKNSLLIDTGNAYTFSPVFSPERAEYAGQYMAELTIDSYEQSGIQYTFGANIDKKMIGSNIITDRSISVQGSSFELVIKRFPIKSLKIGMTLRVWAVSTPSNVAMLSLTVTDINNAIFEKVNTKKQPILYPTTGGGNSTL